MINNKVITIDGLIATGKSTVSRELASKLNGIYLPTGKLYRLLSFFANKNNMLENLNDLPLKVSANDIVFSIQEDLFKIRNFEYKEEDLYSPEAMDNLSMVAANQNIRDLANETFRKIILDNKNIFLILEGRDAGTIIFPKAFIKFWLDVEIMEAAKRRMQQIKKSNPNITFDEVLNQIKDRDKKDSSRNVAPIIIAEDAIVIDTTNLTQEEVIEKILLKVKENEEKTK